MNDNVDFAGRIIWKEFTDAEGKVCRREVFNFGQHRGEAVADVVRNDPGFISWMLSRDFTYDTKNVVNRIRLREAYKNK
jgi:DNA polymerase-3 subunit epsilon